MTEDVIEWYAIFNTKGCPNELIFGNFHDQAIPPKYYDFLNDDDGYDNNIPENTIDNVLPDN